MVWFAGMRVHALLLCCELGGHQALSSHVSSRKCAEGRKLPPAGVKRLLLPRSKPATGPGRHQAGTASTFLNLMFYLPSLLLPPPCFPHAPFRKELGLRRITFRPGPSSHPFRGPWATLTALMLSIDITHPSCCQAVVVQRADQQRSDLLLRMDLPPEILRKMVERLQAAVHFL